MNLTTSSATMEPPAGDTAAPVPSYIGGEPVGDAGRLVVRYPYTGEVVGEVRLVGAADLERAIVTGLSPHEPLTRYQRHEILTKAGRLLEARRGEFALTILRESGLCIRETRYEVGRALDVLRLGAAEVLKDDGQTFAGDVGPQGKARKVFTTREPVRLVAAITPFNHPLNQVAHKVVPAIVAGAPMILKPSDKTPLTAIKFTELLYEAGLPPTLLSVLLGSVEDVIEPLVRDDRVELVTFTGSVAIGKRIAATAGYKRLCLELGGNDPLIVLDDADLDLAVTLAAEGCYRNSGQRCTAVKRLLVHDRVLADFTERFVSKTKEYLSGDPQAEATRVGTVIDERSARHLESVVRDAVAAGARVLQGGQRRGALLAPTVIADVPRDAEMVVQESFGPLAPIMKIADVEDAIALTNGTAYGLSAGVVTESLAAATRVIKGLRCGSVNVNEVPGWRVENSPFGGIKDSGLGIKEGVVEAVKFMTNGKTFSLPW